jgi:hypothetical protein
MKTSNPEIFDQACQVLMHMLGKCATAADWHQSLKAVDSFSFIRAGEHATAFGQGVILCWSEIFDETLSSDESVLWGLHSLTLSQWVQTPGLKSTAKQCASTADLWFVTETVAI